MISSVARGLALAATVSLAACTGGAAVPGGADTRSAAARLSPAQTLAGTADLTASLPKVKSVVVLIMENRDYDLVVGSPDAPYINKTLIPASALLSNGHAIGHPSQPNYLALFSGSNQGVTDDSCPHTFSAANMGGELLAKGRSFDGYSESMPSNGYTGCGVGEYARKHNPWVDFTNIPASSNLVFTAFPAHPPTVAFIVPNLCNDMHDCSTQTGDTWLSKNLPPIITYNAAHEGLLILTWDEADPDNNGENHIPTILTGPMVKPGKYPQDVNHYGVSHTIESITGVACVAQACGAPVLTSLWK